MKFELSPFHRNVPDGELRSDLRAVANKLGLDKISIAQYEEHGKYSAATIIKRFNSWNDALEITGLSHCHRVNVSRDELVDDIKRVAALLAKPKLTFADYNREGHFGQKVIYRHFKTWRKALSDIGLEAAWRPVSTDELFDNLEAVWRHLGRQPTIDEMVAPLSRFNGKTYAARFGGYRKALEAFVAAIESGSDGTQVESESTADNQRAITSPQQHRRIGPRTIGWRLRFLTLRRDGFRCRACGRSPANNFGVELVVDHIEAWSNGGDTVLENLQTLCVECNGGKSNLDWAAPANG